MDSINEIGFQYTYLYAAVNLFCLLIAFLIRSRISHYVGNNREVRLLRAMVLSYMSYLILEVVWVLALAGVIPMLPLARGLIKVLDTICIPVMVYFWFWFAVERFQCKRARSRSSRILLSLPIILMLVLYAISFFTGIVFRISPQQTVEIGPLFILTGVIDNFYGAAIIVLAITLSLNKKNHHMRKDYFVQILFILVCTISGILDAIIAKTPVMTLAIAFAFVYLFINLLEPQVHNVYNDALTGLYNRRRADLHLTETIETASAENPFYLFIADVNHFKKINDTMGHLEGDRALKTVADAIVSAADAFHGFVARWGGDEFLIVINHPKEEMFPAHFTSVLNERLNYYTKRYAISYSLGLTLGHSICESAMDEISTHIEVADQMLYQNRREALLDL